MPEPPVSVAACRRLAPLPDPLVAAADGDPSHAELRDAAAEGALTKFFDVNLTQLLTDTPIRDTIEIRDSAAAELSAEAPGA